MEVGRPITLWFIICCCVNIIYTEELADNAATTPPGVESSNRSELETGNLSGIIEAHKNGTKLKIKIHTKVFWENNKSIDYMTCAVPAVEKKGDKGDKGDSGVPGIKGEMGEKGSNGTNGLNGSRGDSGTPGVKGEKGDAGKCEEESKKKNYGRKENPAYSCSDIPDEGLFYVNKARSFEVHCNNYNTYISDIPLKSNFTNLEKNKKVWLSSKKLDLKQFYGTTIPNLSYLMLTNVGFKLTLTYSDEVEILEILSWTGITKSIPLFNGCTSIKHKNDLEIKCSPPNYLPMDFFIEAKNEHVSIVGEKGSNGTDGLNGSKGDSGTPGVKGEMGERGIGLQGEKGEKRKCEGEIYVNKARSFKVYCNSYNTFISDIPKKKSFTNLEKNKKVWLSFKKLDLKEFYGTTIRDLSYLMLTNVGFKLTLTYCDEVEILEILSWTGITKSIPLSSGCKSINQTNLPRNNMFTPQLLTYGFFDKSQK